jgi:3-oxoacyl-[acyl-carrier-protein] synthase-3
MFAKIAGTGSYLPEKILTNQDLESIVDTTDEWITTRTGIKQRHIAAENETAADMGAQAAQQALSAANLLATQIELIIVATATPDRIFPSTACLIQAKLGCKDAAAFDLSAACSGFVYLLSVADQYIKSGKYKNILIIGTETYSKIVDWNDRNTCVLFGDGAGAVVLSAADEPGIIDTHITAMGEQADILYLPNAGLDIDPAPQKLCMQGKEVFKLAVNNFTNLVLQTLEKHQLCADDLAWLVPHQANIRIIESLAKRLPMPMEKVLVTLHEQGNTSAASIPLALDNAVRSGKIVRGDLLLLAAFGGGITWGSALITY